MAFGSSLRGAARGCGARDFWEVWAAHEAALRQLCLSMYKYRHDEAEDLLRTAMTRAWDRWPRHGPSVENPGAWLSELTRNLCLTSMRTERRREGLLPKVLDGTRQDDEHIEEAVHRRHMLARAMQVIDGMPPSLREPFVAFALYGQSYTEVAQTYGLTFGSIRARVKRARQILAAALGEEPKLGPSDPSDKSDASDKRDSSDASSIAGSLIEEIAWHLRDTCVIQIKLETGGTLEYHATFDQGLSRCRQRIQTLEAYVAKHERGWRRRFELANLLIAESRLDEAEGHLRRLLESQPRHLQSSLRLGQMLVLQRRLEDAVSVYEAARRLAASPATRHHLDGLIERARSGVIFPQYAVSQREDHLQRAADAFRAAIAEEPDNLAHYHELALTYETWGKPVEALAAYDAALEMDPDDVYALARCYNSATAQRLFHLVLPRLERAVELDPNYTYALKLLVDRRSNIGLVRGKPGRETLAMAKRLVSRSPNSADAFDAMTRYYDGRCEFDRSVALWREFLTRNPDNAKAWTFYGTALERVGDVRAAAEAYIRSQDLDPGWLDVYWRGLAIIIAAGHAETARAWIREIATRFPNHWDASLRMADAMLRLGDDAGEAVRVARRAVELAPNLEAAWRDYGWILSRADRHEEALEAYRLAWEIAERLSESGAPDALFGLGCALKAVGRHAEANEALRQVASVARDRIADDPRYPVLLGRALEWMDDLAGAERAYKRAMRAGAWWARVDLERLRERLAADSRLQGGSEDE